MNALIGSEFCGRLCWALAHSLWQAGVAAVVASAVAFALRQRSANVRYCVYLAGLIVSLAAFPATLALLRATASSGDAISPAAVTDAGPQIPLSDPDPHVVDLPHEQPSLVPALAPRPSTLVPPAPPHFAPWIAAAYVLGVVGMAIRLALGLWSASSLSRRATPVTKPLQNRLAQIAQQWKLRIVPRLAVSAEVVVPKVVGILRPVILLPLSATTGLAPDQLDMILAHELAHVRRHDLWVNLLQRVAETLLFFNPAIWYLSRRLTTLREFACDELVCSGGHTSTASYAAALVRVAELSRPRAAQQLAALAATGKGPSELRRRVAKLVGDPVREPLRVTPGAVVTLLAMVFLITTPFVWPIQGQDSTVADEVETDKPVSTKKLASGTEIELIAIGTHREKPQEWWNADGTRLHNVPLSIVGARMFLEGNSIDREVIFRVKNLPAGASYIRQVVRPSGDYSRNGAVVGGVEAPAEYQSIVFRLPKKQVKFDLSLAIAADKWEKVVESNSIDGKALSTPDSQIVFSKAFRDPKGVVVVVSHNLDNCDTRTIAVDTQGNEHHAAHANYSRTGAVNQTTFTFLKLELDQIERFELQKREYEWVEFNNLPANADSEKPDNIGLKESTERNEAIRELRAQGGQVNVDASKTPDMDQVVDVTLSDALASDENLLKLKAFPHLKKLFLFGETTFTDRGLEVIASLPELENVQIQSEFMSNEGVRHFRNATQLKRLHLQGKKIDDGALVHLLNLEKLEALHLMHTNVSDAGMTDVVKLPALRELSLVGTRVTDRGLATLSGLPLTSLSLYGSEISDVGMREVAKLTTLEHLQVGSKNLTNAGVLGLRDLRQMEILQLSNTSVTDDGLQRLNEWNELRIVDLHGTPVTGAFLKGLQGTKIDTLSLIGTQLEEPNLRYLEGLPNLRILNLGPDGAIDEETDISDACIPFLMKLTTLKYVHIRSNQVSNEGIERLRRALPDADQIYFYRPNKVVEPDSHGDKSKSATKNIDQGSRQSSELEKQKSTLEQQLDQALKADPKIAMLQQEIATREYWILQLQTTSRQQDSPQVKAYEKEKAEFERQIAEYRAQVKAQIQKEQSPFVVHGRVTDADGNPLKGVTVRAATGMGTLIGGGSTETDANGRYTLHFGPGLSMQVHPDRAPLGVGVQAAVISARTPGWYETNLNRQGNLLMSDRSPESLKKEDLWGLESVDSVVFPNQPREVNFTLAPAATIEGELVGDGTWEIENQPLSLNGDELPPASNVFSSATTDTNGKFQMDGIPPGMPWRFEMRVRGTRGDVMSEPFTIAQPGVYRCRVSLDTEAGDDGSVVLKLRQKAVKEP